MAQQPLAAAVGVNPSGVFVQLKTIAGNILATVKTAGGVPAVPTLDTNLNLPVHSAECINNSLNINGAAVVVKATPGKIGKVVVLTAGSAPGAVHDVATTGGVAASKLVFNIPNTVGIYALNFPMLAGIVVTPGTGQVISVSFD